MGVKFSTGRSIFFMKYLWRENDNVKAVRALLKGEEVVYRRQSLVTDLHMTSCVSSTRHISGFLSCPS